MSENNEKRPKLQAVFFERAASIDALQKQTDLMEQQEYVIEKVVEFTVQQFEFFSGSLRMDLPFIERAMEYMGFDEYDGVAHCLLVTTRSRKEGVLVNSDGFGYARYAAYVPDCSQLDLKDIPVDRYTEHPQPAPKRWRDRER